MSRVGPQFLGKNRSDITNYGVVWDISYLRLLTAESTAVSTLGYHSSGDGGAANYRLDKSDRTSPDNNSTIIVDVLGRRWHLLTEGELNVKQFGAVGDGETDDTLALQSCLTIATTENLGVYIPTGNYVVSESLTVTVGAIKQLSIRGDGMLLSVVAYTGANNLFDISLTGAYSTFSFNKFGVSSAQSVGTTSAFNITQTLPEPNPANTFLNEFNFINIVGAPAGANYFANAIVLFGVSNINMISCNLVGQLTGPYSANGTGFTMRGDATHIPVVFNMVGTTINYYGLGVLYGDYTQGVTINQSNFTGCARGIEVLSTGADLLCVTNSQFNCSMIAVQSTSAVPNLTFTGNAFLVPGGATGVSIANIFSTQVVGNMFNNFESSSTALKLLSTYAGIGKCVVTGNDFFNAGIGIDIASGVLNVLISNNIYHQLVQNFISASTSLGIINNDLPVVLSSANLSYMISNIRHNSGNYVALTDGLGLITIPFVVPFVNSYVSASFTNGDSMAGGLGNIVFSVKTYTTSNVTVQCNLSTTGLPLSTTLVRIHFNAIGY